MNQDFDRKTMMSDNNETPEIQETATAAAAENTQETVRTTRPVSVERRATRRASDVQRYTVDLDREQRRTLALVAAEWEVDKSKIVRTLIYLLEADPQIRARVQAELFADDDSE